MQRTILIVDDEESICKSLGNILLDEGYDVLTANSGEAALKLLDEELPSLVLLDIWLPGIDGMEVLKTAKNLYPRLPVVMMSGHGTIETAVKATKLGAFDFIEKPLSLEKIILTVRHALEMSRLEEENLLLRQKINQDWPIFLLSTRALPIEQLMILFCNTAIHHTKNLRMI